MQNTTAVSLCYIRMSVGLSTTITGLGRKIWRSWFTFSDLAIYLAIFEVIKVQPDELATIRVKLVGCSDRR